MIVYLIGFLSFVFEFVFNKILYNSIFIPLIIITTLVVLEPYFSNKKKYFIYCFLIGFLCDLFYTNSILVNASLFLILGIIVYGINVNITNNLLFVILETIVIITFYRVLSFTFYCVNGLIDFNFSILFKSIYSSLAFNIIYCVLIYFIFRFIFKKFKLKRII